LAVIPPSVALKYGSSGQRQGVIQVTDRLMPHRQTCWNPQRGQKPQNFKAQAVVAGAAAAAASRPHHALDPKRQGRSCDFCAPDANTAEDVGFGRYRNARAVSASNLFKCAAPGHGVVILGNGGGDAAREGEGARSRDRPHDPLDFDRADVAALLDCARGWFSLAAAQADDGDDENDATAGRHRRHQPLHPFLLWNALPRSGASQYHAHAQTMLTRDPVPEQSALWAAERAFAARRGGEVRRRQQRDGDDDEAAAGWCYYSSLLRAKASAGLLRVVTATGVRSGGSGSSSLASSLSAQRVADEDETMAAGNGDDDEKAQTVAYVYASLAPVKDAELVVVAAAPGDGSSDGANNGDGGGSNGSSNNNNNLAALSSPALARALHAALRAVVDGVGGGSGAFNAAVLNLQVVEGEDEDDDYDEQRPPPWPPAAAAGGGGQGAASSAQPPPPPSLFAPSRRRPLVARLVSRGAPTAVASDFGALEVLGGASIGHTDPWELMRMFDEALEAADRQEAEGEAAAEAEAAGRRRR
jgi:hypothetical protein